MGIMFGGCALKIRWIGHDQIKRIGCAPRTNIGGNQMDITIIVLGIYGPRTQS